MKRLSPNASAFSAVVSCALTTLLLANSAYAGHIRPTPIPTQPPVSPTVPPSTGTNPPVATGGVMEFSITPFANMEHGYHVFEPGYRAVCEDGQGVVATALLNINAAINGESAEGQSAYNALIIRPAVQYLRPGATSGSCKMSICMDTNASAPSQGAACQNISSATGGDSERALSWQGQANYQVSGQNISLQTGSPGLSAWHPVFSFAAPNKAFKDFKSPIVLDLNRDGKYSLVNAFDDKQVVRFDMALEGKKFRTGWVSPTDGFLAMDLNGNGVIDDGGELFGEYFGGKVLGPRMFPSGFEALASLDSNHDGVVDKKDAAFAKLVVWRDLNSDGVCQPGELMSLEKAGVKALRTKGNMLGSRESFPVVAGNELRMGGTWIATDGSEQQMADVFFQQRRLGDNVAQHTKWLLKKPQQ